MGIPFHEMYAVDGLNGFNVADRIFIGSGTATYTSGSSTATVAVTWTEAVPTTYSVFFEVLEAAVVYPSLKTNLGFTINIAALSGNLAQTAVRYIVVS